ncbi:hypothetical protein PanWU01x14_128470, partial [Parasponia andersonii]
CPEAFLSIERWAEESRCSVAVLKSSTAVLMNHPSCTSAQAPQCHLCKAKSLSCGQKVGAAVLPSLHCSTPFLALQYSLLGDAVLCVLPQSIFHRCLSIRTLMFLPGQCWTAN